MKPLFRVVLLFAAALLLWLPAGASTAFGGAEDLSVVLGRAAQYVAQYEDKQLGNLLVSETYLQTATFYDDRIGVPQRQQRLMQSDFLILALGEERIGLRMVKTVDRVAVKKTESSFETLLADNSADLRARISAVNNESSRYNIGGVERKINVPTFALKVVRKVQAPRFAFSKAGEKKIDGVETWEIKFKEQRSPTLTHGSGGESLLSSGSIWIEPATGRVMKTEFNVENPFSVPKAKGRIVVTYKDSKALGMLVPSEMEERYETSQGTVNCSATYSNFRLFGVEVNAVIEENDPPRR